MRNDTLKFALIIFCIFIFTACRQPEKPWASQSNTLRISTEGDPQTLDPRRARHLATTTFIQMLYEGLTRIDAEGHPTLALADSVTISPDQKTYTFHLRASAWSNGDRVTAQDFEHTWKSILEPHFPCPNSYQLFVIRGAQAAKEGRAPLAHVGIHAPDSTTLIVELEQPTPYFLQLTATHFFYPVHLSLRQQSADASTLLNSAIVTNGPFQLENWSHRNELTTIPNPHYWDKEHVRLERIQCVVLDNATALQLFQRKELDWAGSPLSVLPVDALSSLKEQGQLKIVPSAGVYLFRVNTEKPPFDHVKIRQAFALALNRGDLVEYVLQGNQMPAFGLVPYSFIPGQPFFDDHHLPLARRFFQEALDEQSLTVEKFPQVSIHYASGERPHKVAQVVQQQWKEAFGVDVVLQGNEPKVHYEQLRNHSYQLAIGSWFADFRDPISFLEIFKRKENGTNNTQWENAHYIDLLEASTLASNEEERNKLLKQAEHILINEMPVIPLFYNAYHYIKNQAVKGVYFSELGYLDFKHAYLDPQ